MFDSTMWGTPEKTQSSRFQVSLVQIDKNLSPLNYIRTNRFFETVEERNSFVSAFESSVIKVGGKVVYNERASHPSFKSFDVYDNHGNTNYEIVIYI